MVEVPLADMGDARDKPVTAAKLSFPCQAADRKRGVPFALPGLLLAAGLAFARAGEPFTSVELAEADLPAGRVVVTRGAADLPRDAQLVLAVGGQPLARFRASEYSGERIVFQANIVLPSEPLRRLRAWLVAPDAVARLLDRWPTRGSLVAPIDTIGPGGRSAWVRAGMNQGIRAGDHWWLRIGGQPVARLDVRSSEPDACFCSVVPLAAELALQPDVSVELWPAPGLRRRGSARTAVSFVERSRGEIVVWVAAPRHVACPPEPRLDFYRRLRYLGHGTVEARDNLFWYVRFVPLPAAPGTSPAASQPAGDASADDAELIRVGDLAVIRTLADIEEARYPARIFEISPEGAFLNAGETEALAPGKTATLTRAGDVVGEVELQRVQRGYSILRATSSDPGSLPRIGDEVRFRAPPPPPMVIADVTDVADQTLLVARPVSDLRLPLFAPLAIRSSGRTIGVAVLLAADGPTAIGLALEPSLLEPVQRGDELLLEEDEHRRKPER